MGVPLYKSSILDWEFPLYINHPATKGVPPCMEPPHIFGGMWNIQLLGVPSGCQAAKTRHLWTVHGLTLADQVVVSIKGVTIPLNSPWTWMTYSWFMLLNISCKIPRLVGGLEHEFYDFPYIGKNHPNWLSYFSEGWNHQPATSFYDFMFSIPAVA